LVCSESDQSKLSFRADDVCAFLLDDGSPCQIGQVFRDQLRLYYTVPRYGYYSFNLINCFKARVLVNTQITLLNPGNNHLTSTLVPAPTLYRVMMMVWCMLLFVWCIHVMVKWKDAVGLHKIMVLFPCVKVIFTWVAAKYYQYYAEHGVELTSYWIIHWSAYIFLQSVIHLLLILLSRGWCLSKAGLKREKFVIFSLLTGLFILMGLRYLFVNGQIVSLMIALGLITFRVSILVYIFMGVNQTIRYLEVGMFTESTDLDLHLILMKRHKMLISLKLIIFMWLILNAVAFFTNLIFFGAEPNWIDMMDLEFVDFILFACLGFVFRLRDGMPNLFISSFSSDDSDPVHMQHVQLTTNTTEPSDMSDEELESQQVEGQIELTSLSRNEDNERRIVHEQHENTDYHHLYEEDTEESGGTGYVSDDDEPLHSRS